MKKKRAKEVYTLADLRKWDSIDPPVRLGVFGDPVAHSLSPQMQNAALKTCKIDMQYARFQISPDELQSALDLIRELNFVGVNLTTPHKIAASKLMDEIDDNVRRIGAINTVKIDNAKLRGYNTDGKGFARAVRQEFAVDLRDLRVMILGAGGAARAIALQCARENCERLVIANRTFATAQKLAEELREYFAGPQGLGSRREVAGDSVGRSGHSIPNRTSRPDCERHATRIEPERSVTNSGAVACAAPNGLRHGLSRRPDTSFVSAAIEAGARAANGLAMLLYQGALAFEIWFEREAPIEAMREAL